MAAAPDPEMVIALAERLKNARAYVAALESQWESLFDGSVLQGIEEAEEPGERSTLPDRILDLLSSTPDVGMRAAGVAEALGAKHSSVASILSRLVADGRVQKRGFSTYGIADKETTTKVAAKA